MATNKLQGTCSVCLREVQLRADKPIRHGFSAIGVRHGQNSGFHTGPCEGTRFSNLGISVEGTEWALRDRERRPEGVEERIAELATEPELTWYPRLSGSYNKVRGGLPDMSKPVKLRPGEDVGFANDGRPTYANLHRRLLTEQTNIKDELVRTIAEYERVIGSWSPSKYPVTGAKAKVETVHMFMPRTHTRFGSWTGILCRFTRPLASGAAKTEDPGKVTCKKCRQLLGLPPL